MSSIARGIKGSSSKRCQCNACVSFPGFLNINFKDLVSNLLTAVLSLLEYEYLRLAT